MAENEVKMGSFVDDDANIGAEGNASGVTFIEEGDVQTAIESVASEEKSESELQQFREYIGELPHIVFEKVDIAHFVDVIAYHSRLGYDAYTMSFKLDFTGYAQTGKVELIYNNGKALIMSVVPAKVTGQMISCVVSVNTFLRVFSASRGYMYMFQNTGLYGYVFGGRVFIETYNVERDICTKEHLVHQLESKAAEVKTVDNRFVGTLKSLYLLVRTGTRLEEKAIYFKGQFTYIYSGIVMGRFPGVGLDLTLQDIDINTLSRVFFDHHEAIIIEDHVLFIKYTAAGRSVYLAKRGLHLSDDMMYKEHASFDTVEVDVTRINVVVNFLLGMVNNTGVLAIENGGMGLKLTCYQKSMDYDSNFHVPGSVQGKGVSKINIALNTLKTFLAVFPSRIKLATSDGRLFVGGLEGDIVIFGNL